MIISKNCCKFWKWFEPVLIISKNCSKFWEWVETVSSQWILFIKGALLLDHTKINPSNQMEIFNFMYLSVLSTLGFAFLNSTANQAQFRWKLAKLAMLFNKSYVKVDSLKWVAICLCHCAFIMISFANYHFILQSHHTKSSLNHKRIWVLVLLS